MARVLGAALIASLAMCGSQGTDLNTLDGDAGDGSSALNPPGTAYTDPFAGAPAFTGGMGKDSHNAGQACGDCHEHQGSFLVGGTVYKDYWGTVAAPGVEVRVVDTNGNSVSTYTGQNGNFYIDKSSTNVTLPAWVGVRDGTTTRPMITQLTGGMGACAHTPGCHVVADAGGYYPIHIP